MAQLHNALLTQQRNGGKLGQVLIEAAYISEDDLLKVLSRQLGVPVVNIDYRSTLECLLKIPREIAEDWLVLPLRLSNRELEVACADPAMPDIKKNLEGLTGCMVTLRLAGRMDLRLAIARAYLEGDGRSRLLGELLVDAGLITQEDLDKVLALQKESGKKLGEIVQDLGFISPETLATALHRQEMGREEERRQKV